MLIALLFMAVLTAPLTLPLIRDLLEEQAASHRTEGDRP